MKYKVILILVLLTNCSRSNRTDITAQGIIEGDIITLKSKVAGTVEKLSIKDGSVLSKGNTIITINGDKITNQIYGLKISLKDLKINKEKMKKKQVFIDANITYLKKQVQRFKRLKRKNSISGEKLESMELSLLEAETSRFELKKSLESLLVQKEKIKNQMDYLDLILKDHIVKSPVKGVVLEKFVSTGENVFPNTPMVDIMDTSHLYVEIFIEEKEISAIQLNQQVKIFVDGMGDREFFGKISLFGKKAEFSPKYIISEKERESLLYRVKIIITKDIVTFKIGMPVTVVINKK